MFFVIEKIEGQWAIMEWGKDSFKIPKSLLPNNAKQGDKVKIELQLLNESDRLRR
ncbi:MAG: DUF3006 family protein [Eubacteriales bacterium]